MHFACVLSRVCIVEANLAGDQSDTTKLGLNRNSKPVITQPIGIQFP